MWMVDSALVADASEKIIYDEAATTRNYLAGNPRANTVPIDTPWSSMGQTGALIGSLVGNFGDDSPVT